MEENLRGAFKQLESFPTEEDYRNSKEMSYSIFKELYDNPEILLGEKEEKKEEWFVFGTLVDMLLTDSAVNIDNKVVINDFVPSDQFKAIADYILENDLNVLELSDTQVEEVYTNTGSKVNWGIPVKRQKILDNCAQYITLLRDNADKIIVSSILFEEATKVANVFLTHRWTRDLFMSEVEQKANNIEILYQYKIKYKIRDIPFRSMLDVVVIDHGAKKIYPYDIKTGSDYPRTFLTTACYRYKYMYQAYLYKEGLTAFVEDSIAFKDYEVQDFRFVYVSRIKPTYPVILHINEYMHESFYQQGLYNNRYELPAVKDLLMCLTGTLKRIQEGETILEPYDLYKNHGEYTLELDITNMADGMFC